ncbi:MAG: two-component system sensor histidine kinase NtrB [Bryobacteraceae bacterium]
MEPLAWPPLVIRFIRARDLLWIVLFSALALFGPDRTPTMSALLFGLAIFQVAESKIPWFLTSMGSAVSFLIKLVLCYLLIGWTDGVASSYYWILLFPVLSAATSLSLGGTIVAGAAASLAYLSFLLRLQRGQYIPTDQVKELYLRVLLLLLAGVLTHHLVESSRTQARDQAASEKLAEANRNLEQAEASARRSERLAAIGQLSAGLAHELRNPLHTMKTSAELLLKSVADENEVAREMAGFISSEVDRTNSLVTRFLDFARPLALRKDIADVHQAIDRAIAQVERHDPPLEVAIYRNYSPDVRPFPFDSELMERVFYNLIVNAAQASPAHGAVTVKTRQLDGSVEIAVIDRGSGIDKANLESIFNPFFTTRSGGVGLGLPIVSKIVDRHSGGISVESEKGEGTVFRILLPMEPSEA